LDGVRRNSFRNINDSTYLDVTLGRVRNVTRQRRNGADHIITEFQTGTLILSEEETAEYIALLTRLLPAPRTDQHADIMRYPMTQTGYHDDYELRHMQ
jgi:hypothetical protein